MTHTLSPSPPIALGLALILALLASCQPPRPDELPPRPVVDLKTPRKVAALSLNTARAVANRVRVAQTDLRQNFLDGVKGELLTQPLTRAPDDGEPRPVLLVMLDTTRLDHLSTYGYERKTSPHIDDIASEGVTLTRFYANAPWTRPSVASMLLSKYRRDHKVEIARPRIWRSETTVAEHFKAAGYATAAYVGNQTVTERHGFDQGFDTFEAPGGLLKFWPDGEVISKRAIKWLSRNKNPNWFMWLFFVDAHDPYAPDDDFDVWKEHHDGELHEEIVIETDEAPSASEIAHLKARYDGELRQMDAALGRIKAHLVATGQWDKVTVVIVADHGEMFGEHQCFRHSYHVWEDNLNVPFILRSPWLKNSQGIKDDRPFQGIDLAPTLLDLAGVSPTEGWQPSGLSIADVLTGPTTEGWDRNLFAEIKAFGIRRSVVLSGDYKYMRFEPTDMARLKERYSDNWEALKTTHHDTPREFLFNLREDPGEHWNRAQSLSLIRKTMAVELSRFNKAGELPQDDDIEEIDPQTLEELRALGYIE